MTLEVHPPGDWSQEDFEEETPLVRKSAYDELQAENDRLNMEMLAYRQALTPKDLEAMTSVIKALTDEKARRSKAHP